MRVRCVMALVPGSLSVLAWAGAGCGTDPAPDLFDDAGPDTATNVAEDAGPLLLEVSDNGTVDFGLVECGGAAPAPKKITLKNTGPVPIVYRAALDSRAAFVITGGANAVIPQGSSATITMTAQPIAASAKAGETVRATLTLSDSYGHVPLSLPVTMTAHGGTLTVSPAAVPFGTVALSKQAMDVPLTISNSGNEAITVIVTPPADADFSVVWTGAPAPAAIAPGQSLAGASARFLPSTRGMHKGEAAVVSTGAVCGGGTAHKITLTGTGGPAVDAGTDAHAGRDSASDGAG